MTLDQWTAERQAIEDAGGVPPGWTAATWIAELERKIAACDESHQDQAERWRRWIEKMEST